MEIIQVEIKELKPNPKNPRKISKAEMNKLIRSIKEFGFVDPVIVNKHKDRYNFIIGGHQRVEAAARLGHKTVPVVYVDLPEEKESLLNVALNEISGEWDDQKLFNLLSELQEKDIDLTLTGFDEPFIDEIMAANQEREKEDLIDMVPSVPEHPKSKPGEVYLLGDHRVMCGNSTKEEDFKKLMNGKIADMCWTDLPYIIGVKFSDGLMEGDKLYDYPLYNSKKGKSLYYNLALNILKNIAKFTKENPALYICYADRHHTELEKAMINSGFVPKQQLIWEKGHTLTRCDYHYSHECILYAKKKGVQPEWYGDRTHKTYVMTATIEQLGDLTKERLIEIINKIRENSDIIHIQKDPATEYLHSTQKPVQLSRTMIKNNSRPKEIIVEPCGGSGSVLIACQSSGRICYLMELDSRYTSVIIDRWQNFTNKQATRESDGKLWDDIKKEK